MNGNNGIPNITIHSLNENFHFLFQISTTSLILFLLSKIRVQRHHVVDATSQLYWHLTTTTYHLYQQY
jgi:hypothetical protein